MLALEGWRLFLKLGKYFFCGGLPKEKHLGSNFLI
jgi:hypothetical protein